MEKELLIEKIKRSKIDYGIKQVLYTIISDWDVFSKIKKKHSESGLLTATYRELGVKALFLYDIDTLDDVEKILEKFS